MKRLKSLKQLLGMIGLLVGLGAATALTPRMQSWNLWTRKLAASWARPASVEESAGPQVNGFAGPRVRVLTFNLQNLFDAEDDPRTRDEEYLPLRLKRRLD